jgi:hypothetical protein
MRTTAISSGPIFGIWWDVSGAGDAPSGEVRVRDTADPA